MKTPLKMVISCGGTGGHFFPGLAVARELSAQDGECLLFLGGKNASKQSEIAASFGIRSVTLSAAPLSSNPLKLFMAGVRQLRGWFQARRMLKTFKPDALLAMGSFTSLPGVLAAAWLKIPLFLHDGNARIGKANRKFARFARTVYTAFPAVNASECPTQCIDIGMPIRPELLLHRNLSKSEAVAELNAFFGIQFNPDMPILLIFGGSLGARTLNQIFPEAARSVPNFQVIHLTGNHMLSEEIYPGRSALVRTGTDRMDLCYSAADFVISRAGGSTLAELSVFGKGGVVIPYPYASEDHQNDNARYFSESDALVVIQEGEVTVESAKALLNEWLDAPEEIKVRNEKMQSLGRPEASKKLLAAIRQSIQ